MLEGVKNTNSYDQPIANEELVSYLKEVSALLSKKQYLEADLEPIEQKLNTLWKTLSKYDGKKRFEKSSVKIWLGVLGGGVLFILLSYVISRFTESGISGLLFLLGGAAIVVGLYYLIAIFSSKPTFEKAYDKEYDKYDVIDREIVEVNNSLQQYDLSIIPSTYRNGTDTRRLYELLRDQRAVTVQEAINLYEMEKQNHRMQELQQQQVQHLANIQMQQQKAMYAQQQINRKKRR